MEGGWVLTTGLPVSTLQFRHRSIREKKDTVRDTKDVWSDFLAVQWLRLHASTQVAHVGSLVREVPHASQCTPPPQKKIITENVKLLEENIGSSICDHGLGNYFLDMTFKA